MRRVLSVLGSTGSIGKQTLEVVRNNPDDFSVAGLSCGSSIDLLLKQILEFCPRIVSVSNEELALKLKSNLKDVNYNKNIDITFGVQGNIDVSTCPEADTVVGAMVGVSGLKPTYEAILKGKDIALANKETLVSGGDVVMPLVDKMGVKLLPVDSEHCAIWQCLWGEKNDDLDRILITASGGPFRGWTREALQNVTRDEALNHPTWKMGGKITIDSSTMMNKGLEIIEASHLFNISADRVDVVVHPQSVIHSMIRMKDGSVLAQMGKPSMILPIMVALYYPDRGNRLLEEFDPFDVACNSLTFEKCDTSVFRLLDLAYDAGKRKGYMPCIMNAANEVAVNSFLEGKISYIDIERIVMSVYDQMLGNNYDSISLESILEVDLEARRIAGDYIAR